MSGAVRMQHGSESGGAGGAVPAPASPRRFYGLDCVRATAMLLGVFYHLPIAFMAGGFGRGLIRFNLLAFVLGLATLPALSIARTICVVMEFARTPIQGILANSTTLNATVIFRSLLIHARGFMGWSLTNPLGFMAAFPDFLFQYYADEPYYFMYFLAGWWLYCLRDGLPYLGRTWLWSIVLGIAGFAASQSLSATFAMRTDAAGYDWIRLGGFALYGVGAAYTTCGFIGFMMWVAHIFDGRPISTISEVSHEYRNGRNYYRAKVESKAKVQFVRTWFAYASNPQWRDLPWYEWIMNKRGDYDNMNCQLALVYMQAINVLKEILDVKIKDGGPEFVAELERVQGTVRKRQIVSRIPEVFRLRLHPHFKY